MTTKKDEYRQRTPSGSYRVWRTTRPSAEAIEANKKALRDYVECGGESYCVCCETHYRIPSVYSSVQEHGVCQYCLPFIEGRDDGYFTRIDPTVEEVMTLPVAQFGSADICVLRNHVRLLEKALMLMRSEAPPCDRWSEETIAVIRALDRRS